MGKIAGQWYSLENLTKPNDSAGLLKLEISVAHCHRKNAARSRLKEKIEHE